MARAPSGGHTTSHDPWIIPPHARVGGCVFWCVCVPGYTYHTTSHDPGCRCQRDPVTSRERSCRRRPDGAEAEADPRGSTTDDDDDDDDDDDARTRREGVNIDEDVYRFL